jgi:hypothetical protein
VTANRTSFQPRHGHASNKLGRSPEYSTWHAMVRRCTNPRCDSYPHYGGRGIRVCERWQSSFEAFLADMGPRPAGTTIDRIDVNGNYEPSNCRWADNKTQRTNQRRPRGLKLDSTTAETIRVLVREGGAKRAVARRFGISPKSVRNICAGKTWKAA